jgi:hypothetical protein
MTVNAALFVIPARIRRENYFADMARFSAWVNVKDGEKLPTLQGMTKRSYKTVAAPVDFDEQDVIDMFYGKGILS